MSTVMNGEGISLGWTADDMARLTAGRWLVEPAEPGWSVSGICAEASQFSENQMLLAPAGVAGLNLPTVRRLANRSRGIIAEAGEEYGALGVPVLEVPDLRATITQLAVAARDAFQGKMIAVTGSAGKTTTVAMVAHAFGALGISDRSRTSANSHYGIGWNLASMRRDAGYWVQEMAVGRMDVCSHLVRPDVAIITTIAPAHLENFGTTANIAKLKARIFLGMRPGGIAVINRDMTEYAIFKAEAEKAGLQIVCFGEHAECDARLVSYDGRSVRAVVAGDELCFELGAPGRHMAMNALAVLAAACALGQDVSSAAEQFASFQPLSGRGKRSVAKFGECRIEVWDEAYNANPASMRAACDTMQHSSAIPAASRVLVVGDMLELGPDAQAMHLALKDDILAVGADRVLFCGPLMKAVADLALPQVKGAWFPDVEALVPALKLWIRDGDTVLLKASHGTHLDRAVRHLAREPAA